jgi:hypothetical protein
VFVFTRVCLRIVALLPIVDVLILELHPRLALDDPRIALPFGSSDLHLEVSDDQYLFLLDCPEMSDVIADYIVSDQTILTDADKTILADAHRGDLIKTLNMDEEAEKKKAEKKAEKKQRQRQKKAGTSLVSSSIWIFFAGHKLIFSITASREAANSSSPATSSSLTASSSLTVSSISQEVIELKSRLQATITAMETMFTELAEQKKTNAEQQKVNAEQQKVNAEQEKVNAEQEKVNAEQEKTNNALSAQVKSVSLPSFMILTKFADPALLASRSSYYSLSSRSTRRSAWPHRLQIRFPAGGAAIRMVQDPRREISKASSTGGRSAGKAHSGRLWPPYV